MQRRRRPSDRDRRYLDALIGWGYQPSDVERLILAQPEPVEPAIGEDAEPVEADDAQPVEGDDAQPVEADDSEPRRYQKDGKWWYRYQNPVTGEVRPFGPFPSEQDAQEDHAQNVAAWAERDLAVEADEPVEGDVGGV